VAWSVAEGGAARRHRRAYAGEVAGHHVGVALDHDGLLGVLHGRAGEVDAVEHLALLVDRGLGGVEVLGLDAVVVEDPARTEADRVAVGLADRPDQAAAEAVVVGAAVGDEARRDGLLVGEPATAQVAGQRLAVARGESDPEQLRGGLVEAALVQELPGHHGVGGGQLLGVERLRDLVRLDQPAPGRAARAGGLVVAVLAAERDAVLLPQSLDRLGEGEAVDLHDEGDDVAALLAAEAVEELARRVDVERRRLLVVEGTEALQ
jgi:hypothetical protein